MQHSSINGCDTSLSTINDSGKELEQILAIWENNGLEPIIVSEGDIEQSIRITNNPLTNKLSWDITRCTPVVAFGIIARTMYSVFKHAIKNPIKSTIGDMNIAVSYKDGKLIVGVDNINDLNMATGVLAAALWEMLDRLHGDKSEIAWTNIFTNDN